ncbi:IS66 family insertion sequence element accessory protein TnpB [Bradyrhizobium sp. 87]|nr:IS66 family insertion sequence element accessory protein TnpB [Bradyrhizobium sp. 87]
MLIKILLHDGLGRSLYASGWKRGRFLWPSSADGVVTITPAQLLSLATCWRASLLCSDRLFRRPAGSGLSEPAPAPSSAASSAGSVRHALTAQNQGSRLR